ncbi:MAG: signal peptidase I [Firmicutes bacterium]|nr:signal peptidase I [Bacillota bacterium]
MNNQTNKRASGRDTANLSDLLEFDFDSVASGAEQAKPAEPKPAESDYLDSFFEEDKSAAEEPEPTKPKTSSRRTASSGKSSGKKSSSSAKRKAKPAQSTEMEIKEHGKAWTIFKGVLIWSKDILIAIALVWLLITFVAQNCTVDGSSMSPTLVNGDCVLMNKFIYRFTEPHRGDVIVFKWYNEFKNEEELLIKRIIGMPGDTIEIIDGSVYINGKRYDESAYLSVPTLKTGDMTGPFIVPDKSYFVMGDNRDNSKDSRYTVVGAVSRSAIVGKAAFRYWPLSQFKVIT